MSKNRGRPNESSATALFQQIKTLAPSEVIHSPRSCYDYCDNQLNHLTCPICYSVVSQPVELGCDRLVCASCCLEWLEVSEDTSCPVCHQHELDKATIRVPHAAVLEVLSSLIVCCKSCKRQAKADHYDAHESSRCTKHYITTTSVNDILSQSSKSPTLPVEKKVAENLVRRLLAESSDNIVRIPTKGQVLEY